MIEHPSQTTQTCAALPVSSDRMFLFTSAANQGRDGTWTGGDLPGVRDGAAAQCCFHAYRHHVPQQSSKLMLHRQAVCTLQYSCHVYISCLLQGALPLSFYFVAIHSPSVQRLNACIAFGKHINPNVCALLLFILHLCNAMQWQQCTLHPVCWPCSTLTGTATSLSFSCVTGMWLQTSHPVCIAGLHVPV